MAYKKIDKRSNIIILVGFLLTELLFNIPIMYNGMQEGSMAQNAIVVHMLGESSLDRKKVRDELDVLGREYSIEVIDRYNQDLGLVSFDSNNFDLVDWYDNYYYIHIPDSDITEEEYKTAFYGLIMKQPMVFVKSRIRAFLAAGRQEDAYNLYLPCSLLLAEIVYSIIKKKREWFVMLTGIVVHMGLTTLAMPASFFKYFFQMYLVAYTFLIIMIIDYQAKNSEERV